MRGNVNQTKVGCSSIAWPARGWMASVSQAAGHNEPISPLATTPMPVIYNFIYVCFCLVDCNVFWKQFGLALQTLASAFGLSGLFGWLWLNRLWRRCSQIDLLPSFPSVVFLAFGHPHHLHPSPHCPQYNHGYLSVLATLERSTNPPGTMYVMHLILYFKISQGLIIDSEVLLQFAFF